MKTTTETAQTPKASGKALGNPNKPLPTWEWTGEAELPFWKLKRGFTETLILQHLDTEKAIIFQPDASIFAITGILNQYDGFANLGPVNFYARKSSPAKKNYVIYDQELLAIVETVKEC
jgi:hypothetical protein